MSMKDLLKIKRKINAIKTNNFNKISLNPKMKNKLLNKNLTNLKTKKLKSLKK